MALTWISDEKLIEVCQETIIEGTPASSEISFKNVVDPFSALFDIAIQKISISDWKEREIIRQHQKTLQNFIGDFHQRVLGAIAGWEDLGNQGGVDVRNTERKIIVELKNKHNTVKKTEEYTLYEDLVKYLESDYKGYTAYYVTLLTRSKRKPKPFTPSHHITKKKAPARNDILKVDGRTFYEIVTGDPNAFKDLCSYLPEILEKATEGAFEASTVLQDPFFNRLVQQFSEKPKKTRK